ncbi:MAG: hypothetical protein CSA38_01905 [Flavobacteriales bacterium]|nr:MAG: hypothetical protein CSA38_01905 [Flavobacteriales bacterium]
MDFERQIIDNKITKVELLSALSTQSIFLKFKEGSFSVNKEESTIVTLDKLYFTDGKVKISFTGKNTSSGFLYQFKLNLQTPSNLNNNEIIQRFKLLKSIKIHFCNGHHMNLCRNDIHQNRWIVGDFNTNDKFTKIKYSIKTIFPITFE